ncbi:FAD-binding protein [Sphingomonas sp. KC8]|uniref:FAD-binding protein n=1 Tax=Sphingomonas sp. KC8 TaxID=1030157 RepID=UPI0002488A70|nr:FAD-binding protein [Sphingomonas sp. KC8]ARS25841.1 3-ketosteroid-delta-1-dehydrogenase [Sphingomonas sp. KC8]
MDWNEDCDVLVIGSGAGGLVGALTAAKAGLKTIVVEATDRFGGTTAYSGGGMWLPCNAVLKRAGDDDTMDEAREYYRAVVGDRTPRAVQDAFLENGAGLIDFLEADPHLEFVVYPWPDYYGKAAKARAGGRHIAPVNLTPDAIGELRSVLRSTLPVERLGYPLPDELEGGQALIGRLLLALKEQRSADLRLSTPFEDFVVEDGAVVGVVVRHNGRARRIQARRGVLVAAGGFERNAEMRQRFGVPGEVSGSVGGPGSSGRPIEAGIAIGADVDLMGEAWWAPGILHPDGRATFSLGFTGGIFVDGNGERFTNESSAYDRIGRDVIAAEAEGRLTRPYWMVYDSSAGAEPPVIFPTVPLVDRDAFVAAGYRKQGATLEALAAEIGVPADRLAATVDRYSAFCDAGKDADFDRGGEAYDRSFMDDEGASPLVPIRQGPFHAAAFSISDLGTKGGLRTDGQARVLRADGSVIPGLYAAGNSMAAASGETYPGGGNPVGSSAVFSWIAANAMMAASADG